ncbi:ATP-binding protein [Streptomyces sp. NPDC002143]
MTSVTAATGNLPAAFTSFVGRRREIAQIRRLLGTARLVTLTGVGGVGKTRLALEAAAGSRKAFEDGAWLVDLAPVQDPSTLASVTATALGVPDIGTRPVLDQLASHLAGRRALIVMDNCEHVFDACAELVHALLAAAAELHILATSRRTLGMAGEHVFTVAPLSVSDEAVELLRDRAAAVRPEFEVTEANRAVVSRVCADLDGLPLAIELAASRLRTLTVEQVADRLEDRFALLTGGSRTVRPQQRTLRALIDWSFGLCTPAERLLWMRLSIFVGGFCLEAAEEVCSGEEVGRHQVLDLLDRLVAQSVVLATERDGQSRYTLLETIREYGRQRLSHSGEEQLVLQRHADFYLALATRIADGWYGPGQEEALSRLRAEHGNLLAALGCGADPQATLALAAALRFHWCAGGFLGEGRRQLDRALEVAPEPTPARAGALWVAGWVALRQGDLEAADQRLDEAGKLGEQLDDPVVCAYVQGFRGSSVLFRGRLEEAASLLKGAVAAHSALGERTGAGFALIQLAVVEARLGDPSAAEANRQVVAAAEAHGERWIRAQALLELSLGAWLRYGDREAAMAQAWAVLEIQRGFNDYFGVALMLELLAWIAASDGDHQRAAGLLGAVRGLRRDTGIAIAAFVPLAAEHHTRCEEAAVRALGPDAYDEALAEGSRHDSPGQAIAYALDTNSGTGTEPATPATTANPLTRREREVAALVAEGMSNRQIAAKLVLSRRTVDGHIDNIRVKLGFTARARIAVWWTAQASTP